MNAILEQINSAGFVFVKFAVPMLVQSAVLIVALLLADLLLRKKVRAVFRYWLWMLVLLKLLLPTTLSSPVSIGRFMGEPVTAINLDAQQYSSPAIAVSEPKLDSPSAVPPDIRLAASSAEPTHLAVLLTWQGAVLLLWLGVVCVMLLLLLQRAVFVCGLVRQSAEADGLMNDTLKSCCRKMGVRRTIGLKVSPNATSPAVCGLSRPVILLPHNLAPALGSNRLRTVLFHELAHIRRGDLWINLAQTILQIIYFYNPLLWLANSVIRRIREQAVDEAVQVAMGANAPQYPQTLVDVAKMAFNRPALSLRLIGVVESKNALKGRIERMLNRPIPKTEKLGFVGAVIVALMGLLFLPMANAEKQTKVIVEEPKSTAADAHPVVVGSSPKAYSNDVSADLKEITVTFNQPMMDKSWSWVRWDAPYPETVGSPYYDDEKKICTLPVKLEAGQAYLVAFNVEPYIGFVNAAGEPAKPYVLVFATKGEDGKPTPIPEELITKAKSVNERAEIPYTQEAFEDIQPDGTILFKTTIREINRSDRKVTTEKFINSDFVHVTGMSDAKGRPIKFTSTHGENIYRYEVTFNEPVLPGEVMEYTSEGTMEGLVKPVPDTENTFQYFMRHWPAAGQPTLRTETYLLPEGAELISTTPEDMQRQTKDGRIELHVEKTIPAGGSITTAFQYRLTGLEKIVEQAVMTISTCAESDPRVEQSLESLQGLDEQAVVKEVAKFLDSDKNTVRRSAIYILWKGNLESIATAVPHLQKLCSHEEEYTRGMAALAIGARKVEPAFDTLCNMTLNDSSPYARRCAAYALGLLGRADAKPILEKALKDSDFNVRNNAEAALTMLSQVEKPK
jgi:beta-lactamase regulating signal transducer with metallopeptidase domain